MLLPKGCSLGCGSVSTLVMLLDRLEPVPSPSAEGLWIVASVLFVVFVTL